MLKPLRDGLRPKARLNSKRGDEKGGIPPLVRLPLARAISVSAAHSLQTPADVKAQKRRFVVMETRPCGSAAAE